MRKPVLEIPLFPLPSLAHFPGHVLPLHIFEPRYRALMRDALKADARFAMAVFRPGWEPHYEERPPIFEVVTIGSITKYKKLPDGRYMLHLLGVTRARVQAERDGKPYRVGRVTLLEEEPLAACDEPKRMRDVVAALKQLCGDEVRVPCDASAIGLVDAATIGLPTCIEKKMEIYSTCCHAARIDAFVGAVREILARKDAMQQTTKIKPEDPSLN